MRAPPLHASGLGGWHSGWSRINGELRGLAETRWDRAGIAVAQHRQHPGQGVGEETDVDQRTRTTTASDW